MSITLFKNIIEPQVESQSRLQVREANPERKCMNAFRITHRGGITMQGTEENLNYMFSVFN